MNSGRAGAARLLAVVQKIITTQHPRKPSLGQSPDDPGDKGHEGWGRKPGEAVGEHPARTEGGWDGLGLG